MFRQDRDAGMTAGPPYVPVPVHHSYRSPKGFSANARESLRFATRLRERPNRPGVLPIPLAVS